MSAPVVISGVGPVSSLGLGIDATWAAMTEGRCGLGPISAFKAGDFLCSLGGEVDNEHFSIRKIVPKSHRKATKVMCRDIELAVAAAAVAIDDAGLVTAANADGEDVSIDPGRMGCHIGAGLICSEVNELTAALRPSCDAEGNFDLHHWGEQGMENLTPLWLLKYLPNMLACHVTIVHDCRGPSNTITCGESSAALSLGESLRVIERGDADACLTGGAESRLNPLAFYRQCCSGRLVECDSTDDASTLIRPFASDADGTLLGEGGGLLVLESSESLAQRGGRARATVDAFACTQTYDDDGFGASPVAISDAMQAALESAGCDAADIDAIVPFGSGIPVIDTAERDAMQTIFGDRCESIPLICTVPFTGNCSAGNGAIGLCIAAVALNEQRLPARINAGSPHGLASGQMASRATPLQRVMVLSVSQGGQNTAVILGRPPA